MGRSNLTPSEIKAKKLYLLILMIYYSKVEKRKLIFKKKLIFHEVQSVIILGVKLSHQRRI